MDAKGLWYVAHALFETLLCFISYDIPRIIGKNHFFMDADVKVLKSLISMIQLILKIYLLIFVKVCLGSSVAIGSLYLLGFFWILSHPW